MKKSVKLVNGKLIKGLVKKIAVPCTEEVTAWKKRNLTNNRNKM